MKRILLVTICSLFMLNKISAQFNVEEIRSLVQNNIVAYQLNHLGNDKLVTDKSSFLKSEYFIGDWINLLMEGQKMQLKLEIFLIKDLSFPDTTFELYGVFRNKTIFNDSLTGKGLVISMPHQLKNSSLKYLVAVNKYDNRTLFISGDFYLNGIANYFKYPMTKDQIIWFTKLKLFSNEKASINHIIERKSKWEVVFDNNIGKFYIPKSDPDNILYR